MKKFQEKMNKIIEKEKNLKKEKEEFLKEIKENGYFISKGQEIKKNEKVNVISFSFEILRSYVGDLVFLTDKYSGIKEVSEEEKAMLQEITKKLQGVMKDGGFKKEEIDLEKIDKVFSISSKTKDKMEEMIESGNDEEYLRILLASMISSFVEKNESEGYIPKDLLDSVFELEEDFEVDEKTGIIGYVVSNRPCCEGELKEGSYFEYDELENEKLENYYTKKESDLYEILKTEE